MKWHKLRFNQMFKVATALILLLSVGSISTVGEARHVQHAHVRINRQIHRNPQKKPYNSIRFRKRHVNNRHARKAQQPTWRQINRNRRELYWRTFYDTNLDRIIYRRRPLRINRRLNMIGQIRSRQLSSYLSHNMPYRNDEARYLLGKRHIKYQYYGENIASIPLGTIQVIAVGSYNNPTDAQQSTLTYHSRNGYQLANNINNASMYHDAGDDWGHRTNILSRRYKQMGIGTYYSPKDQTYYMAIEFIN